MKIQRISEKSVKFHFYKLHYNQWAVAASPATLQSCAQKHHARRRCFSFSFQGNLATSHTDASCAFCQFPFFRFEKEGEIEIESDYIFLIKWFAVKSNRNKMSIGVPIKVLHEAEGHIITCETNTGEIYRGKLVEAEDNMNCQMTNITVTYR